MIEPGPVLSAVLLVWVLVPLLFMAGVLPIPVGYDRGKIKFLTWCGTGMHAHICYWHVDSEGSSLQTIHPDDLSGGDNA